ncbi:sperm-associated antigen 1 [Culex quinquefasciatus]|uniref:sperm-associated antigen 1 n=1 Tax=Culex quinquefasciatus TaxID=7176 RepID=UPI0018E369C4|nr:sperm-associated antigen 1 [Culex quinquefasciatus]
MANKPKRLLEKYDLLLEHLDFGYIGNCSEGVELERIVKVLRSGEEGFFPQLTEFAEQQLRQVKPGSKLFRRDTPLVTRDSVAGSRWEEHCREMESWEESMRSLRKDMLEGSGVVDDGEDLLPPVRSVPTESLESFGGSSGGSGGKQRIKSCDYESWSRYDPDTEILKMDLEEERYKDFVKEQNEKNSKKAIIEELPPDGTKNLTESERKVLATKFKEKGNDHFRAKEYELALAEYGNSVKMWPTAAGFNNRAMAHIKLFHFKEAIADCDECLKFEPENIKALLRKGQALCSDDKRREAYQTYSQVLLLDPANKLALNAIADLRRQLPDLPPPNSFQLPIEEVGGCSSSDDFADLIKPKKLVKDKLPDAVKALQTETARIVRNSSKQDQQGSSKKVLIEEL